MFKNIAIAAVSMLTLMASFPANAMAQSHKYAGRVTALTATTISVYDKEIITIGLDDQTSIVPWIREKPFVRKASDLSRAAVKVGSLVKVRTGPDGNADIVQVADDIRNTFGGRVVAFTDASLSVYDREMAVVTLGINDRTSFTQLFTVKPWVRKTVHLAPGDLKIGAFVEMFPSKTETGVAARVEIATDVPLLVPVLPSPKTGN